MNGAKPKAAVIGGSIGGLAAGICLRDADFEVDIFERAEGKLGGRGAGIVVQPQLSQLLHGIAGQVLPMTHCAIRRQIEARTGTYYDMAMPQQFTSWEAIITALRKAFPAKHYHTGLGLTKFTQDAEGVALQFGERSEQANMVVFADGASSSGRRQFEPDLNPTYAGYIAWRGTVAESDLPQDLQGFFNGNFSFTAARDGGHALCYFIPGDNAATAIGSRRLNWVWYETVASGPALDNLLTETDGTVRANSVRPGRMSLASKSYLRDAATEKLDHWFQALIHLTDDPFIQAIEDLAVDTMAYGRVCLLGDAAFVVRPHTAGAAAKASSDAMALAEAVTRKPSQIAEALMDYEAARLPAGKSMSHLGLSLGTRSVRQRLENT